ncbi:phenazine biosynthesis FMN-dependent oxidase PhzG [Streptomyces sp. NPDC102451]|uniref:phenazine biosynthesis FMN-dependent oxidase PhzG n=1 Tax=Streptomyces sp. NPDC102451 TaxID=3366177 RepID=UPI0038103619
MTSRTTPAAADTLTGDTTLSLPEFDAPPEEPLALLRAWLDGAHERGVREAKAAVLATADSSGRPSSRVVSVKEADAGGLVFTSFRGSRKGRELADQPWASLTFYWRETLQQLTVAGTVEPLADGESDRLFAERPRAAQATTAVSRQSRPLDDEPALRERARELVAAEGPLTRPAEWTGYRLLPGSVEFWYGSPDRLHRRLHYERPAPDTAIWTHRRLQP